MPDVSVIIPCYNYARFLPECVNSVLTQPEDVRVLIIDDASTDDTAEVAANLAAADSRVEFWRHEVNKGHIATYNEGLQWAAGEYTVLLSADDLLAPGSLGRAKAILDSHPGVGMIYGRSIRFISGDPLPPASTSIDEADYSVYVGSNWIRARCEDGDNPVCSPEVVVRTSLQRQLGGYREELPHTGDLEMWMRFAAHSDVCELRADQAYYRKHGANMHATAYSERLSSIRQRKAAFDMLFSVYGSRLAKSSELSLLANENLAREAIWEICEAYDRGGIDRSSAEGLIEFATSTCVRARRLREYRSLRLRMNLGRTAWRLLYKAFRRPRQASLPVPAKG